MEKNCANCKYYIITGGDWVPYGTSGAQLHEYEECDHPDLADIEYPVEYFDEGKTCPYFNATLEE